MPQARISLTLSCHFSLSFIASGGSSGLHPLSSHSCCMYDRAGRPAFARPYVGVHGSTSLMSSSMLLQQWPACLVRLTCIVFWPPSLRQVFKVSFSWYVILFWWCVILFWWYVIFFWWYIILFWWYVVLFWWYISFCSGDMSFCSGDISFCSGDMSFYSGDMSFCSGDIYHFVLEICHWRMNSDKNTHQT